MSRTKKIFITTVGLMGSIFLYTACSGSTEVASAPAGLDCRTMINSKCVKCHYKTRICDALGTKSKRNWKRTVKFMVKQGAQLTKDDQKVMVECLNSMPKGSDTVCK
jgi:cytochrome c5